MKWNPRGFDKEALHQRIDADAATVWVQPRAGKRETFLVETVMPSGKFATNDLVLSLAVLAFNISRAIGQATLISPDSPVRHPAKRRRIRTVMQDRGTRHTLPRIGQSNW